MTGIILKLNNEKLYQEIFEYCKDKGGVYILKHMRNADSPIPKARIFNIDNNGILYIGKALSFVDRVIALKKTILMNSSSHIAGRKIRNIENWVNNIPNDELFVQLLQRENPEIDERNYLNKYLNTFGELPPLNSY